MGADRRPAGSIQLGEERPLCRREDPTFPILKHGQQLLKRDITRADGYANHPLSSRGNHYFGCERKDRGACRTQQAQSAQSGHRQKGCRDIALYKPAKPGLNISTKQLDAKIGPSMQKLSPASGGVQSHNRSRGQKAVSISALYLLRRAADHESIAGILPSENASKRDTCRQRRLEILQAVHAKVDTPLNESLMNLLRKKAFAADICQAAVLYPITRRTDDCLGYEQ